MAKLSFDGIDFPQQSLYGFPGQLTPIAMAVRGDTELKGGGVGKILAVAVAIAVPFVAPAVASAIGLGSSILASAATGAVLGGLGAAATGGNFAQGALMGGIGAGAVQWGGGLGSTSNPLFGTATTNTSTFLPEAMGGNATTYASAPTTSPLTLTPQSGVVDGSGATVNAATQPVAATPTGTADLSAAGGDALNATRSVTPVNANAQAGLQPPMTPEQVQAAANANRWTDVAIMSGVNAAGQLVGAMANTPAADQAAKYEQELAVLKTQDQAAYKVKLAEYNDFLQNARSIDPTTFAQASANDAQLIGTRRLADAFRGTAGAGGANRDFVSGEQRRANIGLANSTNTAYNQGYNQGVGLRTQALQTAANMRPTDNTRTNYMNGLNTLAQMNNSAAQQRNATAQGTSQMLGQFAYPFLSRNDQYYRDSVVRG
jgi:hypothetical protein